MPNNEQDFLNVQQSAKFLNVSVKTIRLWARAKKIKGIKVCIRAD